MTSSLPSSPFVAGSAASLVYEARQLGRDVSWAKAEFEKEARRVPKPIWNFPKPKGYLVISIGVGIILLLMVLVVIAVMNQTQVWELMRKVLGR